MADPDHDAHRAEAEQRWGRAALLRSDQWWRGLDGPGREAFLAESAALAAAWQQAWRAALPVDGEAVRALAARHIDWITEAWGGVRPTADQIRGLAEMYVADERFAANYGGEAGAAYVRDALLAAGRS